MTKGTDIYVCICMCVYVCALAYNKTALRVSVQLALSSAKSDTVECFSWSSVSPLFFSSALRSHTHTHKHACSGNCFVRALSTYARVCLIECYLHINPSRLLCELVAAQFFACFAHSQMNIYWNPVVNCNVKQAEIFAQLQFIYILRSYWAGLT